MRDLGEFQMKLKRQKTRRRKLVVGVAGLVGLPVGMEVGAQEGMSLQLGVEETGWREMGVCTLAGVGVPELVLGEEGQGPG
ncbi:hypothetical protein ABBQ38_003370 [Trebouxia sp. C0009 RCD-2024]